MESHLQQFQDLEIQLEEETNSFPNTGQVISDPSDPINSSTNTSQVISSQVPTYSGFINSFTNMSRVISRPSNPVNTVPAISNISNSIDTNPTDSSTEMGQVNFGLPNQGSYMQTFLQQFQHLEIQLEDIKSATNNFTNNNIIGVGGFGKVYKGEVSHSKGRSMAAIKRHDRRGGQGTAEFLKEITSLSRYNHENLIPLLGFCYQGDEMILVYELASRGSLDRHLSSSDLTWTRRLKICLDAAKGLCYLHHPTETHERLIHCDIKSGNILLDDQWNAKVCDLGLSVIGPAHEQHSVIVGAAGTQGYIDPQYMMTSSLTKESDVYSFGVVLFEVLCGRLCCTYSNGRLQQILVPRWIESYKQKKLNDIIFKNPTSQPIDQGFVKIYSDIAYRCLNTSREERPMMTEVVTELETAIKCQEFSEREMLFDYEEMTKSAEPPLNYRSKYELWKLLFKGVLLNEGKTWFSLNKNEEHCEMISFAECLDLGPGEFDRAYNSRFAVGPYRYIRGDVIKARVKTQFLSPGITYTVNLVFRNPVRNSRFRKVEIKRHAVINLKYKLDGETNTATSYLAYESEDGYCWMCELYQFTTDQTSVDYEILFEGFSGASTEIEVEGIEFRPLEEVEHTDGKQPISDLDANWEENFPTDYEDIIQRSKNIVQWKTKKEAYSILCKGFLINDGQEWFSLHKNGKICHMLSARVLFGSNDDWGIILSLPGSRFGEAFQCSSRIPDIIDGIRFELLSSETRYASYLVYQLPKDQSGFEAPIQVEGGRSFSSDSYIYLVSPQTPVIRPKAGQNTHSPLNRPKIKGLPRQRDDGWMEVQIMEFLTSTADSLIPMHLEFFESNALNGLIIQGLESRPI